MHYVQEAVCIANKYIEAAQLVALTLPPNHLLDQVARCITGLWPHSGQCSINMWNHTFPRRLCFPDGWVVPHIHTYRLPCENIGGGGGGGWVGISVEAHSLEPSGMDTANHWAHAYIVCCSKGAFEHQVHTNRFSYDVIGSATPYELGENHWAIDLNCHTF